jgi:hypothetical protein
MAVVDLHSLVLDIYFIFKCQLLGTEKKRLPAFEHQWSDGHKVLPITFVTVDVFEHVDKRIKNLKYIKYVIKEDMVHYRNTSFMNCNHWQNGDVKRFHSAHQNFEITSHVKLSLHYVPKTRLYGSSLIVTTKDNDAPRCLTFKLCFRH